MTPDSYVYEDSLRPPRHRAASRDINGSVPTQKVGNDIEMQTRHHHSAEVHGGTTTGSGSASGSGTASVEPTESASSEDQLLGATTPTASQLSGRNGSLPADSNSQQSPSRLPPTSPHGRTQSFSGSASQKHQPGESRRMSDNTIKRPESSLSNTDYHNPSLSRQTPTRKSVTSPPEEPIKEEDDIPPKCDESEKDEKEVSEFYNYFS